MVCKMSSSDTIFDQIALSTTATNIPALVSPTWCVTNATSSAIMGNYQSITPEPEEPKVRRVSCEHSEQFSELERRIERNQKILVGEILNLNLKLGAMFIETSDTQIKLLSSINIELRKLNDRITKQNQIPKDFLDDLEKLNQRASELFHSQ